jgi:ATP-dependent helicase HrpB
LIRIGRRVLGASVESDEPDDEQLLRWTLLAYPDRVVRRRGAELTGVMVGGRGIRLEPESVVRQSEFFVAIDPRSDERAGAREARVRIASAIRAEWLRELFPAFIDVVQAVNVVDDRRRPARVKTVRYLDLVIAEDRSQLATPAEMQAALAAELRPRASSIVRSDRASQAWLARFQFLSRAVPENVWPEFDDDAFGEVIEQACNGKQTVDEVVRTPFVPLFQGRLAYEQNRALEEHAPESLIVPSGSRIRLIYQPERPPILEVRLQELFGWVETPRVAYGRVPILLRILAPNFRPVQVTDDLRSFWSTTYFQVRKDLRGRYPRHSWPEDPLTARPEAKGRPTRKS